MEHHRNAIDGLGHTTRAFRIKANLNEKTSQLDDVQAIAPNPQSLFRIARCAAAKQKQMT
jgi:hypothetical protein